MEFSLDCAFILAFFCPRQPHHKLPLLLLFKNTEGAYAAAGSSSNGNIFVWNLHDGSLKKILEDGHGTGVAGFAWGRGGNSGQQVASVDRKGFLVLWA